MGIKGLLQRVVQRHDLVLAVLLIAVVFMMILPLPTWLVDVLIATNLTFAVVLLMMAIYIHTPLEFTAFPSLLLLTTLFRLSLSITTTRLILLQGDAGKIVYTFGEFVVGGNLVVGAVIFLIITIVQFLVITKGSERVAEVSARFSLDAMPGKQMSIDGDMRAGTIDVKEAQARREQVEKESQLYGAMDGAMKFVKGDAIAGLIIIVVNLIGGITIGMTQHNLSAGDAVSLYALLTIGDGLISQIPALLIAITSGMIVTRVSTKESADLGKDIQIQVKQQPNALMVAGIILLLFATLPGFPTFVFLGLSLTLFGIAYHLTVKNKESKASNNVSLSSGNESDGSYNTNQNGFAPTQPLSLSITEVAEKGITVDCLIQLLTELRQKLTSDLGVPYPTIHLYSKAVADETTLPYQLLVHEVPVVTGSLLKNGVLVRGDEQQLNILELSFETSSFRNSNLFWVKDTDIKEMESLGIEVVNPLDALMNDIEKHLLQYASNFIGVQETRSLLDHIEPEFEELVREVQRQLPLFKLTEILQRLVAEQIPIRNLRGILEAVIEWAQKEKSTVQLTEYVRMTLSHFISHKYSNENNTIIAFMLTPEAEEVIRSSIRQTSSGNYLAMDPSQSESFLNNLIETIGDLDNRPHLPVIITAMDIRRYVKKLIEPKMPELSVLSFQELSDHVNVHPLDQIDI
ncbi:type III secretion system export apparatus subunit SctV [Vibrio sp. TBV020]|uniref:type III secretion system export apparatus subunit SctV n=1 Tax=Vibrio sp. TBV020 TaxID=3137398 RepID=UPI0038CDB5D1